MTSAFDRPGDAVGPVSDFVEPGSVAEVGGRSRAGVVQLWRFDLDPRGEVRELLHRMLDEPERARAARFRMALHQHRFAVGRGILRHILGGYVGCDPREIAFEYGPQGKPAIARTERGRLEFNLTHSASMAVVAVTWENPLGVDVETLRDVPEALGISRRFFTETEQGWLLSETAAQRSAAFLRVWTRKEAYIKGKGGGLSMPLDKIDVSQGGIRAGVVRADGLAADGPEAWRFRDFTPDDGHVAALAFEGPVPGIEGLSWTERLLERPRTSVSLPGPGA